VIRLNINSSKITGALWAGLTYPVVLLLMLTGILYIFGIKVLPPFDQILPMERWTGAAAALRAVVVFAQSYLIPFFVGMVLAIFLFIYTAPRWSGALRSKFDRMPPWSLYRLVSGGGFLMSVAALVGAGVAVPEVLRKLRRQANPWMQVRIDAALREVNQGANLGDALHRSGHGFPDDEIVDDLRIYASLASFDESLRVVADEWVETVVEKIQGQAKVLNSIMILAMGFTVMFLDFGLYAIMRQISNQAGMGGRM
jgi:type II secretory pathway component PulF